MSASPTAAAVLGNNAAAAAAADNDDGAPVNPPRPLRIAVSAASVAPSRESVSESSDEGLRMSPAAARRFARRNLRRTSATPDLVTSLVRPPSPDAAYIAPGVHARLRPGGLHSRSATFLADLPLHRTSASASDRRSGPLSAPHPSSLDIPKRYGGGSIFDLYALVYVSDPDPSLQCPICHDPLVDPVTTPCDHTFCYRCLRRSIASSPSGTTCPIDREPLSWLDCFSAARLVRTQLNLVVKCPYHARGCGRELSREAVERHATTECRFRDYSCPDSGCNSRVAYKPKHDACPHREMKSCPNCDARTPEAELDAHFLACSGAKTRCLGCWQLLCRSQMEAHRELECDGIEVPCPHQDVGCSVRAMRGEMSCHARMCAFHPDTPSGVVIRAQRDLIESYGDMGSQLRDVKARQAESDRRIDELMVNRRRMGSDSMVNDNRTMQDLDAGFEEVHQNLTQLEARQSMWTLNQVMPIREEVTELRNNINMIRMHVNWLLNRSREEGRIRAANNTGSSSGIRRDSSGEAAPVLPERRRSSGTEMGLPRL